MYKIYNINVSIKPYNKTIEKYLMPYMVNDSVSQHNIRTDVTDTFSLNDHIVLSESDKINKSARESIMST